MPADPNTTATPDPPTLESWPTAAPAAPAGPPGFALHEEVGRGGMGVVYRARDLALARDVAVKLLRPEVPDDSLAARRFVAEAAITAQLQHPGIPPVYCVGHTPDGRPFLAMRLIKGRTLAALLAAPDRRHLVAVFEAVCQAVGYAHAHGVVHRDLKPANVMVGAFGEVQVMDWGLAKHLGDEEVCLGTEVQAALPADVTRAGSVLGTPAYMAPEQAAGEVARLDRRTDVFGLGAVLCGLLTGAAPYRGGEPDEVRARAAAGDLADAFERLHECGADPALVALCKRCLSVAPEDRPVDAGAVATAVAELRQAADDRARRAERAMAAWRVRRRAAAILTAVLVAAGVVGVTLRRQVEGHRAAAAAQRAVAVLALRALTDPAMEDKVARQPELTPEDRQFLRTVRQLWDDLPAGRDEPADALALRAEGAVRVGEVCQRLGDGHAAADALRAGVAAYAELTRVAPDDPAHRLGLVQARAALAALLADQGDEAAAEAEYRAALAEQPRLTMARPRFPADRREFAAIGTALGGLLRDAGRLADAETVYRSALALRDGLTTDFPADPRYRRERAATAVNLGKLLWLSGRRPEALAEYERAVAAGPPDGPSATPAERQVLAYGRDALADTFRDTGRHPDSEREYRTAIAAHRALAAEFPGRPAHRIDVARGLNGLANLLEKLGRRAEAEAMFREALAVREKLAADAPGGPNRRRDLAGTHVNLAALLLAAGRTEDAADHHRAALAVRERLTADFPARLDLAVEYAGLLASLGLGERLADRPAAAEPLYDRAVQLLAPLREAHPTFDPTRAWLLEALTGRAQCRDRLGRPAEALADWDAAAPLGGPGDRPTRQACRAVALRKLGREAEAAAAAAEAGAAGGFVCYTLARYAAAGGDADGAVAWLRRAVAAGWRRAALTRGEPDFEPLRGRLDFRWLLAMIEARDRR